MRARLHVATMLLFLVFAPTVAARSERQSATANANSHALTLLADIVRGHDQAVTAAFNPQMRARLTTAQLAQAWASYQSVFGGYRSRGTPRVTQLGHYTVVQVPLRMSRQRGEFRITFQPDGKVAGLYFLRYGVPL